MICCCLLSGSVSETMKYLGIAGELFQIAHPNPNLFLVGVCVSADMLQIGKVKIHQNLVPTLSLGG